MYGELYDWHYGPADVADDDYAVASGSASGSGSAPSGTGSGSTTADGEFVFIYDRNTRSSGIIMFVTLVLFGSFYIIRRIPAVAALLQCSQEVGGVVVAHGRDVFFFLSVSFVITV